ncbi:hypothetical protein [Streptomyces racemochromogenes]|uniref:hypothetical protein n=1 Tax=Streptomyces racemochromogenes TaxID=67353 RepID=UPI0031E90266
MNASIAAIKQPTQAEPPTEFQIETAWAERDLREQLINAYEQATTRVGRAAARWDILAYDMANPGVTKLADQLDDHRSLAA